MTRTTDAWSEAHKWTDRILAEHAHDRELEAGRSATRPNKESPGMAASAPGSRPLESRSPLSELHGVCGRSPQHSHHSQDRTVSVLAAGFALAGATCTVTFILAACSDRGPRVERELCLI